MGQTRTLGPTRRTYADYYAGSERLEDLESLVLAYMDRQEFDRPCRETMPRYLMLVISELAEALEEMRSGQWELTVQSDGQKRIEPRGFGIEIAQALIRLLHITSAMGLEVRDLIALTMAYSEGRPKKHGREF